MEEPYFYTGRVPISLRHIINDRETRKESTIEAIGGQVHSHLLTFSAEALKRRSEAITPGGRHDIKAAWTEQKKKPHPKAAQTPDANKKPGTPNNSPAGGAGPSSANGREPTQRNTQQTAHDSHGVPKSARRNGPLFYDPERHNQGTPKGKKPRTQDMTPAQLEKELSEALQDYYDPRNREFFIKSGLTPPSLLTPMNSHNRTQNPQRGDQKQTHNPGQPHKEPQTPSEREEAISGSRNPNSNNQAVQPHTELQIPSERDASQLGEGAISGGRSPNSNNQTSPKTGQQHTTTKKRQASPLKTTTRNKKERIPNAESQIKAIPQAITGNKRKMDASPTPKHKRVTRSSTKTLPQKPAETHRARPPPRLSGGEPFPRQGIG
jgi:hypothetical protein